MLKSNLSHPTLYSKHWSHTPYTSPTYTPSSYTPRAVKDDGRAFGVGAHVERPRLRTKHSFVCLSSDVAECDISEASAGAPETEAPTSMSSLARGRVVERSRSGDSEEICPSLTFATPLSTAVF